MNLQYVISAGICTYLCQWRAVPGIVAQAQLASWKLVLAANPTRGVWGHAPQKSFNLESPKRAFPAISGNEFSKKIYLMSRVLFITFLG